MISESCVIRLVGRGGGEARGAAAALGGDGAPARGRRGGGGASGGAPATGGGGAERLRGGVGHVEEREGDPARGAQG
eukprot:7135309-Pyramimonas_sp.AAC.1